jgi:hypothetical protein
MTAILLVEINNAVKKNKDDSVKPQQSVNKNGGIQ